VPKVAEEELVCQVMSSPQQGFNSSAQKLCNRILHHPLFDPFFGVILVANLSIVILETDATARKDEQPLWVDITSWIILALFVFELMLRLYVYGFTFWLDGFNRYDFIFVTLDVVLNVLSKITDRSLPELFLQIARLSKLARTAKAFRVFPELRTMLHRLVASFRASFWRAWLLSFTLLAWSVVAVWFMHPLNMDLAEKGEYEGCDQCAQAYASISNAFVTFCRQIATPDGWGPSIKPVIEHYPMTVIFYASVFLSVAMAMVNLIVGMVSDAVSWIDDHLDEDALQRDTEYELRNQFMEVQRRILELRKLMSKGDPRAEKQNKNNDSEEFKACLGAMDIGEEDLRLLWAMLDADTSSRQRAPHAFMAESLALEFGMEALLDHADAEPLGDWGAIGGSLCWLVGGGLVSWLSHWAYTTGWLDEPLVVVMDLYESSLAHLSELAGSVDLSWITDHINDIMNSYASLDFSSESLWAFWEALWDAL